MVETTSISLPHSQDSICPQPSKCPLWNLTGQTADIRAAQLRMRMSVSSDLKTAVESQYKLWNQRPLPLHPNPEHSIKSWKSNWKQKFLIRSLKKLFPLPLSADGHWCQFNTNRTPQFGVCQRRKLNSMHTAQLWHSTALRTAPLWNSSIVLQLHQEAAWLWNSKAVQALWQGPSPATQLPSALPNIFGISAPASKKQLLVERENRLPEPQESCLI